MTCRLYAGSFRPPLRRTVFWGGDSEFAEEIESTLLPALPSTWPEGSVRGLRARGGFVVDIDWKDGKVTDYRISGPSETKVTVSVNGELKEVNVNPQPGY